MNILLGITGSIAAYKSVELARLLTAQGAEVKIILSESAEAFITPLTLSSFYPGEVYHTPDFFGLEAPMLHIDLARFADIILVAPISAHMLAKLATGQANCLLSAVCLASEAKLVLAPAMNQQMWKHAAVQANVATLVARGADILGPAEGIQACGDMGYGRMLEPADIAAALQLSAPTLLLAGKHICITAGPTHEKIDPVRFIANHSSGKMGYALAIAACAMGAKVTLISGPVSLPAPMGVDVVRVVSAQEMYEAAEAAAVKADIFIGAAAVADYAPAMPQPQKVKKNKDTLELSLKPTVDIIAALKKKYPKLFVVGFAAETENLLEYAKSKLATKHLDMIVANDVSNGKVFHEDDNEVYILSSKKPKPVFLERASKGIIAHAILKEISRLG
jgi:phosphopantothenoylcysteine decarboxylase/phosphopantothenate--cysteine ligase